MSESSSSSSSSLPKEPCTNCLVQPHNTICSCQEKYCFMCISVHAQQIHVEFECVQNVVGEKLLAIEQTVEDNNCENAKTFIENWRRKRIQDINDIADNALLLNQDRENLNSDVVSFRNRFNTLFEPPSHIDHEHLDNMLALQRQVSTKFEQLETLPQLLRDDTSLDSKLLSHLNVNVSNHHSNEHQLQPIKSSPCIPESHPTNDEHDIVDATTRLVLHQIESIPSSSNPNTYTLINTTSTTSAPAFSTQMSTEEALPTDEVDIETTELIQNQPLDHTTNENSANDDFEVGYTANIERRNPIIIPAGNDKFVSTVCCHGNQLLYNNYQQRQRNTRLTFIPNIAQPTIQQNIDWSEPDSPISGGDDNWIQDIAYSTKLQGYFLLSRARLRLLHSHTLIMEEFYEFPDRSMKRITCDETYIYLVCASGATAQNGDEIIMMDYNKQERVCKSFRDIMPSRRNRDARPIIGEISDIAVGRGGQIILSFRYERRQEVGISIYDVTNNGNDWTSVKRIFLNGCWHEDTSYTPRTEWCEKLSVYVIIEYVTGHLIMIDQAGQVKGECHFVNEGVRPESPLNLSISDNSWLCLRYLSSINIHRLEDTRL